MLEASGVEKLLGGESVLAGVDLAAEAGEITVIMGPNGAGKTVLLCCLAGGLDVTAGSTEIRGRPHARARRELSFLLQDSMAIERLTGRENAEFYAKLHPRSAGRWTELVATLDLVDDLDRPVREYSGGMARKLELAIALDPDVPLYLLDEPTAGLDLTTIQSFHDLVLEERDRGKAVVLGSHVPLDMEIADHVLFLNDGRVTASGVPRDLFGLVPDVVRLRGDLGRLPANVTDHLVGGALFQRGDEARGFIGGDTTVETVRLVTLAGPGQVRVDEDEPTYADLFNFLTMERSTDHEEGSR